MLTSSPHGPLHTQFIRKTYQFCLQNLTMQNSLTHYYNLSGGLRNPSLDYINSCLHVSFREICSGHATHFLPATPFPSPTLFFSLALPSSYILCIFIYFLWSFYGTSHALLECKLHEVNYFSCFVHCYSPNMSSVRHIVGSR